MASLAKINVSDSDELRIQKINANFEYLLAQKQKVITRTVKTPVQNTLTSSTTNSVKE